MLSKREILQRTTESKIFSLVFGFEPIVKEYYLSPFRKDNNPKCYFDIYNGKLKFTDFGGKCYYINGKCTYSIDCFDAVKIYYNLKDFESTLNFIVKNIDCSKIISKDYGEIQSKVKSINNIYYEKRNYNRNDTRYWNSYNISIDNLKEDSVFALKSFCIIDENGSQKYNMNVYDKYYYIFTKFFDINRLDFYEGMFKIYAPAINNSKKYFNTNCSENQIGNLENLNFNVNYIVITKSYKDSRLLSNYSINNIWLQSETIFIPKYILTILCNIYHLFIIFFDNDNVGINSAYNLKNYIKSVCNAKIEIKYIDINYYIKYKVKDISDMYRYMGAKNTNYFINNCLLL